ncbi:hypothetical protein ACX1C1_13150 [Paenibacillus sp. strain BS8-2]
MVLAYAEEWQATFGFSVKEAGLYFAQAGEYIKPGTERSGAFGQGEPKFLQ